MPMRKAKVVLEEEPIAEYASKGESLSSKKPRKEAPVQNQEAIIEKIVTSVMEVTQDAAVSREERRRVVKCLMMDFYQPCLQIIADLELQVKSSPGANYRGKVDQRANLALEEEDRDQSSRLLQKQGIRELSVQYEQIKSLLAKKEEEIGRLGAALVQTTKERDELKGEEGSNQESTTGS